MPHKSFRQQDTIERPPLTRPLLPYALPTKFCIITFPYQHVTSNTTFFIKVKLNSIFFQTPKSLLSFSKQIISQRIQLILQSFSLSPQKKKLKGNSIKK